jgi:UDP-glucose 4-epimerase
VSDGRGAPRVLVTGASGLVGRRAVARLAREPGGPAALVALDLREPPEAARIPGVAYVAGDVRDPALAERLREARSEVVVHLAAVVAPGRGSSRELEYEIDVLGTSNVVAACLRTGVRQLVYLSSGAAYGYHADNPVPLRESDPLRGNEGFAYAWHKRLVEEELARVRAEHPGLAQLVLRAGTILGEAVASPVTALFERPVVVGVAGSEAPFVFVWDEDVAECIAHGIRERRSGVFNLAGDGALGLREIARRMGKPYLPLPPGLLAAALGALRRLGLSARGAEQVDFLRHRPVLSNEKLVRELGFRPSLTSEACFERYRRLRARAAPRSGRSGRPS